MGDVIQRMLNPSPIARNRILAVTGLAVEARIAAGPDVIVACAGGGPDRLRSMLSATDTRALRAVISFGLAGGLDPALPVGGVVLATKVTGGAEAWQTDPTVTRALTLALAGAPTAPVLSGVAGADAVVMDVAAKAALHGATGAAAVDMESHAAAEFAAINRLPLGVVRVICDPAWRALPPLTQIAVQAHGRVDVPAVLRSLARDRSQIGALMRTARDFATAVGALRRCRRLLGLRLGLADLDDLVLDMA